MSEDTTENMDGGRSFEDRVFLRFDALDASIRNLDERVERLEERSFNTKPIWERALKEIAETRQELSETRRELSDTRREMSIGFDRLEGRFGKLEDVIFGTRADLREAEGRIEKLEEKSGQ
ncbi:MAG: hypothetical protein ICV60_09850 [Pyrinomonadaceae bacterium]|nr:hypothetical protein [Pyrinomonadaceae bacterium]